MHDSSVKNPRISKSLRDRRYRAEPEPEQPDLRLFCQIRGGEVLQSRRAVNFASRAPWAFIPRSGGPGASSYTSAAAPTCKQMMAAAHQVAFSGRLLRAARPRVRLPQLPRRGVARASAAAGGAACSMLAVGGQFACCQQAGSSSSPAGWIWSTLGLASSVDMAPKHTTALTSQEAYDKWLRRQLDSGKVAFVRWIHSPE